MAPRSRCPARAASRHSGVRGRVRTAVLSLITLLALAAIVVVVLVRSLSPPETATPPTATAAGSGGPAAPEVSERSSISGTVILAPELVGKVREASVLFLIVRKASGPPFAVKRFPSPRFPLEYRIGAADVMMAGSPFEGEVRVSARISQAGSAGPAQPGDLEGEHAAPVQVGTRNVNVTIARVR
jgi:cytochrome c-type biogenesis protein CcmH